MTLREIIQKIREEPIGESYVHELIVEWLSEDSSSIDIVMEAISMQRQRTKSLLDDMGVRLTFSTQVMKYTINNPEKEETKMFLNTQIEENKKFYIENKKYVKTKGIQIWKDLP